MKWKGALFIILVTILGATTRRLPDVKRGAGSGNSDNPRDSSGTQSSGKHVCTECTPDADRHSPDKDSPYNPEDNTKHHGKTSKGSQTIDQNKPNAKTSSIKPFLSLGGIRIHVNNKPISPISKSRHTRKNKHIRKDAAGDNDKETNKENEKDNGNIPDTRKIHIGSERNEQIENRNKKHGHVTKLTSKPKEVKHHKDNILKENSHTTQVIQHFDKTMKEVDKDRTYSRNKLSDSSVQHRSNAKLTGSENDDGHSSKANSEAVLRGKRRQFTKKRNVDKNPSYKKSKHRNTVRLHESDVQPKLDKLEKASSENNNDNNQDINGHAKEKIKDKRHSRISDYQSNTNKDLTGRKVDRGNTYDGSKANDVALEKEVKDETRSKTDSIVLGGKIGDRWTSDVLSSVPDALRLERRLHPNVNAPIRDIRQSLRNILHLMQGSVNRAEHDYAYAFNSTRWKLMVGVRERLKHLVEENDKVYGVVLQASLLTKDIYRRAHERRIFGNVLAPVAVRSRHEPVITALQLRPLHMKARDETIKANDFKLSMSDASRKKNTLQTKYEEVRNKVIEAMTSRAMFDLSRRAKKTIYKLEVALHDQNARNGMSLHGHMHRNIYVNMGTARNLTHVSRKLLRHVKHQSMSSKKMAEDMLKQLRDRVPAMGVRLPFDQTSMLQWHQMEIIQDHANKVFKDSVVIHVTLSPLLKNAKEILTNYDAESTSTQLRRTLAAIRNTKQLLRIVMDKIYLQLKAEHLLRERCDEIEGSGLFDDEFILIDCDEYVKVSDGGSGDGLTDEEGSGDIDGVAVELEVPMLTNTSLVITDDNDKNETVDIEITDMTDIPTLETDEIGSIFIDDDLDGKLIDETEIKKHSNVGNELERTTKVPHVDKATVKTVGKGPKSVNVRLDKTTAAPKHTIKTTEASIIITDGSDDEDIFKETFISKKPEQTSAKIPTSNQNNVFKASTTKTKQSSKVTNNKTPTTTATTKTTASSSTSVSSTTTAKLSSQVTTTTSSPTTTKKEGGLFNWFGLSRDEPLVDDFIDIDSEDVRNLTFNELLRLKLSNFSSKSFEHFEKAKPLAEKAKELSLTWKKVKDRFVASVNRTIMAQAFVSQWAAESAAFSAVHNRVQTVHKDIELQVKVIDSLTTKASSKAEKKLKTYEGYKEQTQKGSQDVDPAHVQELKDSVKKAKEDIKKIESLTTFAPSPCKVAAAYVNRMRVNISELRHKIEQAKLLASSLQGAVQLDGSSFLAVPVPDNQPSQTGLTNKLDLVLNVTDEEGTLVGVETKDTGSFILKMEDRIPRVIVVDKGKWKIDEQSTEIELEENTWYRLVLERFARTFNLTVYDPDTKEQIASKSVTIDDDDYLGVQSPVIHAYVGGLTDEFSNYGQYIGCVGSVVLDGQVLNMTGKSSNGQTLDMCTARPSSTIYHRRTSLVLNGAGFAKYRTEKALQGQRIQSLATTFTIKSDGLILSLTHGKSGLGVLAFVEGHDLTVFVRMPRGKETTAVFKNIQFYIENYLEFKFRGRPTVTLNGKKAPFQTSSKSAYFTKSNLEELYVGASPTYNRSLVGCIHSIIINEKQIHMPQIWEWQGAHIGICEQSGCVEFSGSSSHVKRVGLVDAKKVYVAFKYGSTGPLLQYIKTKKFDMSIYVDNSSIEIEESKEGNPIEQLSLEEYSPGDIVILQLQDQDSSVLVSIKDKNVNVEYDGGGGWFNTNEESTYSITVGSSTQTEDQFTGQVEEVIVNGRPWSLQANKKKKKLDTCKLRSMSHLIMEAKEEPIACLKR